MGDHNFLGDRPEHEGIDLARVDELGAAGDHIVPLDEDEHAESAAITSYPTGISIMPVSAAGDWDGFGVNATVVTNRTGSIGYQHIWFSDDTFGGRNYNGGWNAWFYPTNFLALTNAQNNVTRLKALTTDFAVESAAITSYTEGITHFPVTSGQDWGPNTAEAGHVLVERNGSIGKQTFVVPSTGISYVRYYTSSAWGSWLRSEVLPTKTVGDDTTDDTSALQGALNAAGANGRVYIPPSEAGAAYRITAELLPPAGITIEMHPQTVIRQATKWKPVFDILDTPGVTIRGGKLTYTGNRDWEDLGNVGFRYANAREFWCGIWTNSDYTHIYDMTFEGLYAGIVASPYIPGSGTNVGNHYVLKGLHFENIEVANVDFGILAHGCDGLHIRGLKGWYTAIEDPANPGVNASAPPHLIYIAANANSRDVVIDELYAYEPNPTNTTKTSAFKFSNIKGGVIGSIVARDTSGLMNMGQCEHLTLDSLVGHGMSAGDNDPFAVEMNQNHHILLKEVYIDLDTQPGGFSLQDDGNADVVVESLYVRHNQPLGSNAWINQCKGDRCEIRHFESKRKIADGTGRAMRLKGTDNIIRVDWADPAQMVVDARDPNTNCEVYYNPRKAQIASGGFQVAADADAVGLRVYLDKSLTTFAVSGGTVTIDALRQTDVRLNVNAATAFTIAAPTNAAFIEGLELTIEIVNNTAGVLSGITWNTVFKFDGSAPALPAAGAHKSVSFRYDGTNWREISSSEEGAGGPGGAHASTHTNGTDDIQNATAAQKGLATATQITKLDGIEAGATADQTATEIRSALLLAQDALAGTDSIALWPLGFSVMTSTTGVASSWPTNNNYQVLTVKLGGSQAHQFAYITSGGGPLPGYVRNWLGSAWSAWFEVAGNASTTFKGLSKLSVAPASATDPIAAGTNDARLSDTRTPSDGSVTNVKVNASAAIDESKLNLASDAAAGTASRRTLGTGATQAAAGNDARLSDQRVPTDSSVTDAKVDAAAAIAESKLNLASDAAAGTASRRTLGTGSTQAAAGNDSRLSDSRTPTTREWMATFFYGGNLAAQVGVGGEPVPNSGTPTITEVSVYVDTKPTTQNVIVDINSVNLSTGVKTTLYTTQGNRPQITPGGNFRVNATLPDIASPGVGSVLTADIDQIGTGASTGANLTVKVRGTY